MDFLLRMPSLKVELHKKSSGENSKETKRVEHNSRFFPLHNSNFFSCHVLFHLEARKVEKEPTTKGLLLLSRPILGIMNQPKREHVALFKANRNIKELQGNVNGASCFSNLGQHIHPSIRSSRPPNGREKARDECS